MNDHRPQIDAADDFFFIREPVSTNTLNITLVASPFLL
jgi:hypothetical protein